MTRLHLVMIKHVFSEGKNNKPLCFVIFFVLFYSIINAQVTADFNMSTNAGCSPLLIQFYNISSGSGNMTYHWNFGNGNISSIANPQASYVDPGIYNVSLTVYSDNDSDTKTKEVYVYANPEVDFITPDSSGCIPHTSVFTDLSAGDNMEIVEWLWDFGDGMTGTEQSPLHTYSIPGNFPVSLKVTDENGCFSSIVKSGYIEVFALPDVDFYADQTLFCADTAQVQFFSLATGEGILLHHWDFGDGNISADTDPVNVFTGNNKYDISLTVTDINNCVNTEVKEEYIEVKSGLAVFTVNKDTACTGENVYFINGSGEADIYSWDFGDGQNASDADPVHSYQAPGEYIVSLEAALQNGCSSVYADTIVIVDIEADFISFDHYGCELPASVQFACLTNDAVSWEWHFGNGNVSTDQHPVNVYEQGMIEAGEEFIFSDTLIVTGVYGCVDTVVSENNFVLSVPKAKFFPDNTPSGGAWLMKGCAPLTVNFNDISTYISGVDSIISWSWDFGDGNTSDSADPFNKFVDAGEYVVEMTVTTAMGCEATYDAQVKVGVPQQASFTMVSDDTICASDPAIFINTSTDSTLINGWLWNFGDGNVSQFPHACYNYSDTGYMDVSLIVYYNGCPSEPFTLNNTIFISEPVASFTTGFDCQDPYAYNFQSNMTGVHRFTWDFGDGSDQDSVNLNPSHIYDTTGNYMIRLETRNNSTGCMYEYKESIQVRDIKAVITADTVIGCPGLEVALTGENSIDYEGFYAEGGLWNFQWNTGLQAEDEYSADTLISVYDSAGTYIVRLIVRDMHGCTDTAYKTIKIYLPEPDFIVDTIQGCTPLDVTFINTTVSDTAYNFTWHFGDGSSSDDTDTVVHTYQENGYKDVTLTVTDILGCQNTITKEDHLFSSKPHPGIIADHTGICIGDAVHFISTDTSDIFLYQWCFGDDSMSYAIDPQHVYADSGTYAVSLHLTDIYGCDSVYTDSTLINCQLYPQADFIADTVQSNCYPLLVNFSDQSISDHINNWYWEFGDDNSISGIEDPQHNYVSPGIFDVMLVVSTSNGCKDTAWSVSMIDVGGPIAQIVAPDTVCKGENIEFIMHDPVNVYDFNWDFGDGYIGDDDTVFHIYNQVGYVYPRLMLYSDSVHTCDKFIEDSVYIHQLLASFTVENDNFCMPVELEFSDQSYGAVSWQWDFGDGTTETQQEPSHYYPDDGIYTIRLVVFNEFGCVDTMLKEVEIFPPPVTAISNDTLICLGQSLDLYASGGVAYSWSPANECDDSNSPEPEVSPESTLMFSVVVTDINGCVNTDSVMVHVQQVPQFTTSGDTGVVIGESAYLNVYSDEELIYYWSPPEGLSCTTCPDPVVDTLISGSYTLTVSDTNNCFELYENIIIEIIEAYTVDLPQAFTPNHDGVNDIVYVRGWGIKELIVFRVFNRWGEIVFETGDINTGWDGYYKGKLQETDTYVYYVEVKTYDGKVLSKKGDITLIK